MSKWIQSSEITYWSAVELAVSVPWFMVQLRKNSTLKETSDMLLSGVDDLLRLMETQASDECEVTSVSLVSPAHMNGGTGWKLEPLAALWEAEEPDAEGQTADVYELTSGTCYARSALGTPLDSLRKVQVIADFR
ncbi:hypothetical protein [Curvibacter lanceolatus]|uniref:hypothetical protein n=1 Tax=Curvibacter lanceolatus TaxID=86182 RepID=UPI0012F7441D|nr:hypothetical protein [Curvibacter lanceolatus]